MDRVVPPEEDGDVPGFWRALGVPGLADVHVHFLPPRMLRGVWEYFDEAGPLIGASWPIRYKWDDPERVAHLRSMHVKLFSALAYAHRPGMAADLNAWTLEFGRDTPGCLPSATLYPEPGATGYVRAALDAGARIFKVHLQVGGFTPLDPQLDEVWGLVSEARVPVVVHAGHAPVGTDYTGPAPFGALMERYPDLTAIVAHLGAPDYGEFLRLAEEYERVRLDTTMVFTGFFDRLAPFPAGALAAGAGAGDGREDPARQRLPEPPLPVRAAARGPGPARPRRGLAARGVLGQPGGPVRATGDGRRRVAAAVTRSRGSAGVRWPSRPVMSSFATSALTTASSVACTTAS